MMYGCHMRVYQAHDQNSYLVSTAAFQSRISHEYVSKAAFICEKGNPVRHKSCPLIKTHHIAPPKHQNTQKRKKQHLTAGEKWKLYKAILLSKGNGKRSIPGSWVICKNPGMFCAICQKWRKPSAGTRGAWTTKAVVDWSHATKLTCRFHVAQTCCRFCSHGKTGRGCNIQLLLWRLRNESRTAAYSLSSSDRPTSM